jgi:hypothetical protein
VKEQTRLEDPRSKVTGSGFTTELPSGWEDRSITTLVGPTGASGFVANVLIMRERVAAGGGIEEYALRQRRVMEAEVPGLQILDERAARISEHAAYQRLQRFERQGHRIQQAQTFILCGDIAYSITCSSGVDEFDRNIESFRLVVNSFKCHEADTP